MGRTRQVRVVLAALLPLLGFADSAPVPIDFTERPRIQEFVISVSDMQRSVDAFTEVLQWQVLRRGRADATAARVWGLPVDATVDEILVGNPASDRGFVRLVEVKGMDRQLIRPGGRWWDTGGMFNLNVLVRDLDATIEGLRAQGWYSNTLPSSYEIGESVRGKSMIMIGPDDLVLSFQERQRPPLQGWPEFEGASHIEVGYQIVSDVESWRRFHVDVLGWSGGEVRKRTTSEPIGPNDYGLPHNLIGVTDTLQTNVMLPEGGKQSLGARQHLNAEGYDFSARVEPPNLGIMSVRVPVTDVMALAERLRDNGFEFAAEPQILRLPPYGTARVLAVRVPGGSGLWLELFEPNVEPAGRKELLVFFANGRKANWVRFNRKMTGTVEHRADGTAHVSWHTGLDEEGIWTLKGNAVCTAWHRLRDFREQCDVYYRIGPTAYQSFTVDGRPDGLLYWD